MYSLVDLSILSPIIDRDYFPHSNDHYWWSSSPYPNSYNYAWLLNFKNSDNGRARRKYDYYVRLVRFE